MIKEDDKETHYTHEQRHYKPRYLKQVEKVKGEWDSGRVFAGAFDDFDEAVESVNRTDAHRNVWLVDRSNKDSHSPGVRAYGRGYYCVPNYSDNIYDLEHYLDGVLERLVDKALDRHEARVDKALVEADRAWYTRGGPGDLVLDNQRKIADMRKVAA